MSDNRVSARFCSIPTFSIILKAQILNPVREAAPRFQVGFPILARPTAVAPFLLNINRFLDDNELTTLPAGLFDGVGSDDILRLL